MRIGLLSLIIMLLSRCQGFKSFHRWSKLHTRSHPGRSVIIPTQILRRPVSSVTNPDKASLSLTHQQQPGKTTEVISPVLSKHLLRQLVFSLQDSKLEAHSPLIYEEAAQILHKRILEHPKANTSNSALSAFGLGLCRALPRLQNAEITRVCQGEENLDYLVERYQKSVDAGAAVFDAITNHHRAISKEDWTDVAADQASLAKYSEAASAMGARKWVMDCNEWMETFAVSYFKHGTARKHYVKEYQAKHGLPRNDTVLKELLNSLPKDLTTVDSPHGNRIKLLDVGSCYNPIGRSNNDSSLDVTALDLYPADPSVYQADFLNLTVGAKDSQPQVETVTLSPSTHSNETSDTSASQVSNMESKRLLSLPESSFDVVTMSLVLNYLPSPEQRIAMIRKARKLLRSPPALNDSTQPSTTPHRTGLLLIAEKESIFALSEHAIESVGQNKMALLSGWKQAIANEGFSLVKYQMLHSGPKRASHVFAFATTNSNDSTAETISETSLEGKEPPKLWIRQDFEVIPDDTRAAEDGEDDLQERLKRYRASIAGRRPIGIVGGGIGGSALGALIGQLVTKFLLSTNISL